MIVVNLERFQTLMVMKVYKYIVIYMNYMRENVVWQGVLSNIIGFKYIIPAKTLHNRHIVSAHFNHFHCMGICDKLSRHLSMLTYIYLNVDEC